MLAGNNVSAGSIVTKMEFDTNSSTPRLLFAPVEAVPTQYRETIKRQGKTPAAENAIKLTVYKTDSSDDEGDAPAQPTRREGTRSAESPPTGDASDVIKKWAKPGKN